MGTAAKVFFVVVVGFAMATSICVSSGSMSNDDVIKLVKAGMSETFILSSIDSSESQFDTSVDALINLKNARVSDAIIQRMIEKKVKPTSQPTRVASDVRTDKDVYQYGETIRVNYYNAPGLNKDWITIAPAGSPDNEAGDYKNTPPGVDQGVLIFDCPYPGKHEVRAYYNYSRYGYKVSARQEFKVLGDMYRKIDPSNPLEANIPPGKGLVYIFRETFFITDGMEVPIKIGGKPIIVLPNSSYFQFIAPSGNLRFTADSYLDESVLTSPPIKEEHRLLKAADTTIEIKPGFVYYLRLRYQVACFLDYVPHQEGAALIKSNKLTLIK